MKKVVLLLIALSVFCVAKPAKSQPKSNAKVVAKQEVVKDEVTTAEAEPSVPQTVNEESSESQVDDSLRDSTFTLYIHPLNFMVPYSHFWGGINVPNGFTDYPIFNLTFEWKIMEKISLVSMPHYVRVDRSGDDYKIYDIGLQESFRLYGVGAISRSAFS